MPHSEDPQAPAEQRLAELGVSRELFRKVLKGAAVEVSGCTEFDAPAAPGFIFWSRANRFLAEELVPSDWKWTSRDSILRVIHPSGSHAITAISADGGVGDLEATVRSKNPKGKAMARLVEKNGQFSLMTRDEVLFGRELDQMPTWCLLYKRTRGGTVAELSLPVKMNGKYVNEWQERIPVDLPDLGDPGVDVSLLDDPGPDDEGPEVIVEMR
ncbi:hypothetical protein [Actinomadura nitritigenes]|uniref:hypothetical protein n=1 Tax=Actinomadura nitritigenes TaxID=134602 RepID=UPI003D938586